MFQQKDSNNLYEIRIVDPSPVRVTENPGWFGFGGFSMFNNDGSGINIISKEFEKFNRDGHKYYCVPHGKEYYVKMINNSDLRVNAILKIDGEVMGKWRINEFSDILIERPSHSNRKFTFVRDNSWQAGMAGVSSGAYKNGLIEVTFTPEVRYKSQDGLFKYTMTNEESHRNFFDSMPQTDSIRSINSSANFNSIMPQAQSSNSYSSGATVLGDDSNQKFSSASHMTEDSSKSVTKRVRLVVEDERKPFASIKRETVVYDDPTPPPIRRITDERDFRYQDRDFAKRFDPFDGFARPRNDSPFYTEIRPNSNSNFNIRNDLPFHLNQAKSTRHQPPSY